jgi:hypothetical protein
LISGESLVSNLAHKKLNEHLKLFANWLNTIGVLSFVSGAFLPYMAGRDDVPWVLFAAAIILHVIAQASLAFMKSED